MATRSTAVTSPSRKRRVERARRSAHRPTRHVAVFAVVAAVICVAAAIAIIAGNGGSTAGRIAPGIQQTRPVTVTGGALPGFSGSGFDPATGSTTPQLHGASFDGTPVTVTPNGHPHLLLFVAHWCPHCNREMPTFANWLRDGGLPAGVDMTTISTGVNKNLPNYPPSSWMAKFGWTTPVLADSADGLAAHAFGLPGYPYFVVLDANGRVAARASGELTISQLEALVARAMPA